MPTMITRAAPAARPRRSRRTAAGVLLLAAAGIYVVLAPPLVNAASEHPRDIEAPPGPVAAAPRTLRSVLEELCAREQVRLRYEGPSRWAPPRDVATLSVERDLETLLDGLDYVKTLREDPKSGRTRLVALHVLGGAATADAPAPNEPFAVHITLLDAAFAPTEPDPASVERLIEDVRRHPDRLEAFLATDTAVMVESLARYPHAARLLRAIAERADIDPRSRKKLAELLAALE
jgi:hypothetical protein